MEFESNQITNDIVLVSTSENGEVAAILATILLSIDKIHN